MRWLCALALSLSLGCGTLIHPERRGQQGGDLDAGVLVLDGIWLLIPPLGLTWLVIDFLTGAVYEPGTQPEPECKCDP